MSLCLSLKIFPKVQLNSLEWSSVILDGCFHRGDRCQDPQEILFWGWLFFDFFLQIFDLSMKGPFLAKNASKNESLFVIENFSKSSIQFSGVEFRYP